VVDRAELFATTRLLIVAGKGGVGKTAATAALARTAAEGGKRVLVVAIDSDSPLGGLLGLPGPLGVDEVDCGGGVRARLITPGKALDDYLDDHGLKRLAGRLVRNGLVEVLAAAAPGIDDILILGKVKQLVNSGTFDLVLLDAPAAGHAVKFLRAGQGLSEIVNVGPVRKQADDVAELLADGDLCQVVLVTLAEETPVNETIETAFALEDDLHVRLGPVIVNALYPAIEGLQVPARASAAVREATTFRLERVAEQNRQCDRLAATLPLAQLRLSYVFTAELTPADVLDLAHEFAEQLD
jgi:anion-transporting  ArsA/GET3 family ATPase